MCKKLTVEEQKIMDSPCKCECHVKGGMVMHMTPCCDLTYNHYINTDGTIDETLLLNLIKGKEND